MIRKTLFWIHLCCGVAAGLVILMMSATGVILTYERQILHWQEHRSYDYEPAPQDLRLAVDDLLSRGEQSGFEASSIILASDPSAPAILSAGRSGRRYLNPYTGEVYAPGDNRLDQFFSAVTGWHRWFNVSGEGRSTARAITGAANLMFLFLVLSGIYLWLPGIIRWTTLRGRLWFHKNARSGQARDFNWHHVFGIWSTIPLAVIVATATVFNYSWANNLVYRLAGEEPPQRGTRAPVTTQSSDTARQTATDQLVDFLPLEALFELAQDSEYADRWRTITINLPAAEASTVSFSIDQGSGGQPQRRHSLLLDRESGEVASWQPFDSQSAGRQARSWVRFLHTGEALGIVGQTIAGLVSLFALFMVWTGLALSWRRLLRYLRRTRTTDGKASAAKPVTVKTSY